MGFTERENDGQLNGTTPVTVVPVPTFGTKRIVKSLHIQNSDTGTLEVIVWVRNSGSDRTIYKGFLYEGDTFQFGDSGEIVVLDTPDKSIMAKTTTAANSQDLYFVASYGDSDNSGCT